MKKSKIVAVGIGFVFLVAVLMVFGTYMENRTVAKALDIEDGAILKEIPFAGGIAVIYREDGFLHADRLEKGRWGWKETAGSAPLLEQVPEGEIYSVNSLGWFSSNNQTLFWGVVPPDAGFTGVTFTHGNQTHSASVDGAVWVLPVPAEVDGFAADQFSLTLRSGEKLPYPFE